MNFRPSIRAIHDIGPAIAIPTKAVSGIGSVTGSTSDLRNFAQLIAEDDAAGILGLSPHTLANWRATHRQKLPYVKIGRSVRYRMADLESFISSSRVEPACR